MFRFKARDTYAAGIESRCYYCECRPLPTKAHPPSPTTPNSPLWAVVTLMDSADGLVGQTSTTSDTKAGKGACAQWCLSPPPPRVVGPWLPPWLAGSGPPILGWNPPRFHHLCECVGSSCFVSSRTAGCCSSLQKIFSRPPLCAASLLPGNWPLSIEGHTFAWA